MSGFIALHREALEHPLFSDNAQRLGAWIWMVARAAWKPTPYNIAGKIITVERGQLCASRKQMAKAWGMSESAVERFLTRLQTEQMIGRATGQGKSVITICNYAKYQDISDEAGQATGQATGQRSDSDRTAKEQGNKGTIERIHPNGCVETEVSDPSPNPDLITQAEVIEGWNTIAQRHGLPCIAKLTEARKRKLVLQRKRFTVLEWVSVWAKIEQSPFMHGGNDRGWRCDFDFVLSEANFTKILEGKYDEQQTNKRRLRLA